MRLLSSLGRPSVVGGIDSHGINYELVGLHRDAQISKLFDGSRLAISSAVTRNTTVPWYPYDMNFILFRCLVEISATAIHRLGVHHVGKLHHPNIVHIDTMKNWHKKIGYGLRMLPLAAS